MKLKKFSNSLQKKLFGAQKSIAKFGFKTEKGFEKYFLQRLGKIENVGRFVGTWLLLMGLLIGGVIAQNITLSNYYQTVQPVPGGIYKEGVIGAFTNASPVYASTEADLTVSRLVFAGLFAYDQNGQIVGDLAKSYTLDTSNTTYTIKLHPNLKFHDGKPLTSADVVYTYETIQNPDVQSPLRSSYQGVKVTAVDPQTVSIKLPTPLASFIYNLTTGIIPQHILKDVPAAEFRSTDFNTIKPVGAGPFKWSAIEVAEQGVDDTQQQIALSAFEGFYSGPPKLQEMVINTYPNKDKLVSAFKSKQLTAASGLIETPEELKEDDQVHQHSYLLKAATMVFFKTTTGVLADQKVRAALVQASDRTEVIDSLGYQTRPVNQPFLTGQSTYDPTMSQAKFNLEAAKTALIAAGWVEGKDGIRAKGATKLKFEVIAQNKPEYTKVGKILQKQWRKAGADVKVTFLPPAEYQISLSSHSYEAVLHSISIGADPDVFVYWDSTQADIRSAYRMNLSEFKNAKADAALQAGRSRSDANLRSAKYKPFLQAWQAEAPALALYQPRYLYLTNGPVDGLPKGSLVSSVERFENVHNWQIRQAKVTNR